MSRGVPPVEFYHTPHTTKSLADVFASIDAYSAEIWPESTDSYASLSCTIVVPPVFYRGQRLKGILFTHGVDLLLQRLPAVQELFFVLAYGMGPGIPWSTQADGLFTVYANPQRDAWFRAQAPQRAHQLLLPLQDADYLQEYVWSPKPVGKDIDILCVARLDPVKNLPILAQALKILRSVQPDKPVRATLVVGNGNWRPDEQRIVHEMQQILQPLQDYINLLPTVPRQDMPTLYARARCYVLPSLLEGKNRTLYEAMSCDVPVVCFADLNQHIRGPAANFPQGAGLEAPTFDATSLAQTLAAVLQKPAAFTPRLALLKVAGRRRVVNQLVDAIPYYANALPDFTPGQHYENTWWDVAMQKTYFMSLRDFVYGRRDSAVFAMGLQNIEAMLVPYLRNFGSMPCG